MPIMENKLRDAVVSGIYKLLRPLVQILIRNGISYPMATDVLKRVYIDVASTDFKEPRKKKVSASRLSLLTGIHRKDIARLKNNPDSTKSTDWEAQNGLARLVINWANSPAYTSSDGARILPLKGDSPSFASLVAEYTSDVPMSTTLDELLRIGSVEMVGEDQVRLLAPVYYPSKGEREKMWVLGNAGADLYSTINHNLTNSGDSSRYQSYVYYDNLPDEVMDQIRQHANKTSQQFLTQVNDWLKAYDRDSNTSVAGNGKNRAGIGVYYFHQPLPTESSEE